MKLESAINKLYLKCYDTGYPQLKRKKIQAMILLLQAMTPVIYLPSISR